MVLYIHGFASSGLGVKASLFREFYHNKNKKFFAPSLSFIPDLAIHTLEETIQNCNDEEISLIGSSLGGYYSIYLADKYNLKAVLINPSTKPWETLKKVLGKTYSYYDKQSGFFWEEKHIDMLLKYKIKKLKKENFFTLLQTGDETLDYKIAKEYLNGSKMVVEEGGSHDFDGIERYFKDINNFFNS